MRFTSQEEYGLRCMLQLARHEENGSLTIEEIAQNESLTVHYVGKLMRILLMGGLVESTRGQKGGYQLIQPAVKVSIADVLTVLDGPLFRAHYCERFTGLESICVHSTECSVRALWSTIDFAISRILDNTMLKDLVSGEKETNKMLRFKSGVEEAV